MTMHAPTQPFSSPDNSFRRLLGGADDALPPRVAASNRRFCETCHRPVAAHLPDTVCAVQRFGGATGRTVEGLPRVFHGARWPAHRGDFRQTPTTW